MPNMYVEFGAVIAELRSDSPEWRKHFFDKYQDRIMFGKDSWVPDEYPTYFRVLETTVMNIFLTIKNTMLSGKCMAWD